MKIKFSSVFLVARLAWLVFGAFAAVTAQSSQLPLQIKQSASTKKATPPALTAAGGKWFYHNQSMMGTELSLQFWGEDTQQAGLVTEAIVQRFDAINARLSPYLSDSELSRVNREAFSSSIAVSDEFALLMDKGLFMSRLSGGAFDLSFATLGRHYNYRDKKSPGRAAREKLLPAIDFRAIEFDNKNSTIRFRKADMALDFGGIAKGYAVDEAAKIFVQHGVKSASISLGGDSRIIGDKLGKPWVVGIKNPRQQKGKSEAVIRLPLRNTAVSTSGDYERFFVDPDTGSRIHHIINPKTGLSATGVTSVTVLGPNGIDTDALSTTVFVLGVKKGLNLMARIPGFDCIIIDIDGVVHYSDGLAPPDLARNVKP